MHFGRASIEWSSLQAQVSLNLPSCNIILREARLRYIMQLIRSGQPHVWSLQTEGSWFARVSEDLDWLCSFCPDELVTGQPKNWHLVWWATERPKAWKSVVRRGVERAKADATRVHEWREWHKVIVLDLVEAGFIRRTALQTASDDFYCVLFYCAVHSFKCHKRINIARHYVEGLQCKG